ncbi:hypothetical protein DSUL_160068 [Desulfovibrionales bacterium]
MLPIFTTILQTRSSPSALLAFTNLVRADINWYFLNLMQDTCIGGRLTL